MGLFGDLAKQFASELADELLKDDEQPKSTTQPVESEFAHQLHGLNTQEVLSVIEHPSSDLVNSDGYDEVVSESNQRVAATARYTRENEAQYEACLTEVSQWSTSKLQAYIDNFEEANPMTLLCVQYELGDNRHVNRFLKQGGQF